MANATIKITQLPSIGNALSVSTVLPVVNTTGTSITEKTTLGSIANLILTQAGVSLPAAFVSEIAYSVANAAQPNITSVGTLNINTLHVSGGDNGQYLQTDGTGNLTWVSGGGSGNGVVGGANAQLQFNNEGNFGGDAGLTWAGDTGVLSTLKLSVSSNATIYGNTALTNLNVAGNLTTNNIFTDNYFYANGYVFGGGGGNGVPGGSNTQVQFNDNGVFGGNTGFTFDKTIGILSSPFLAGNGNGLSNIQGANVSGFVSNANVANTAFAVAGANVSGAVTYAATANSVAVANVVGIGNIAVLALDGSTSNVLYGNGVFAPAAGGAGSELVNGNNSFVLDGDGNVVFEGNVAGQAVNRGLVWDYGANANGVNSTVVQNNGGLSVRAWTENGGGANGYSAPVNIITNQNANTKQWIFNGDGNLTVPGNINAINDGGQLGAYLTLTPNIGLARLTGREAQSSVNYTNTAWTSATYTGTQIDFVNAPDLVSFLNSDQFNTSVNQTFSINGGEPVIYQGYDGGVGNDVVVYTDVTADPDPTTVTSIDFYYQLESYVGINYDDGTLSVKATGLTINIDNDQTEGPDINLRSGDDITLQAKDMSLGSEREGGDINLNAGDGADDDGLGNIASSGGDIIIDAGLGGDGNTGSGSAGGFTQIRGGRGGSAGVTNLAGGGGYVEIVGGDGGINNSNTALGASGGDVNIYGGDTTREAFNGAGVNLTSGAGGPNAFAGSVNISTPSSDSGPGGLWQFDGNGILTLPDGAIIDTIGNNFEVRAVENVNLEANAVVNIYTDGSNNAYQWQFGDDGNLTLPGGGSLYSAPAPIAGNMIVLNPHGGGSITNQKLMVYPTAADGDHIHMATGNLYATELFLGTDDFFVKLANTGNVVINSNDSVGNSATWTFGAVGISSNPVLTVDALPATVAGMRAFVSDSNLAPVGNFGAIVGNSGSNTVCVWCDGTNWRIG